MRARRGGIFVRFGEFISALAPLICVDAMRKRLETGNKFTSLEIPRAQRRVQAKSLAFYREEFSEVKLGIATTYLTGDYTLQAIANTFGANEES